MSAGFDEVTVPSFCKVNIGLEVGERRSSGFHEVVTLMQTLDLADELRLKPSDSPGVVIVCDDPAIPTGSDNMVRRAFELLKRERGALPGIHVNLRKRIPAGGGMGGGSANAAVMLLALDRLFDLGLALPRLAELGAELGSDVPYFLLGGLCLAFGRGEKLAPLAELPDWYCTLVFPEARLSTSEIYRRFDEGLTGRTFGSKILSFLMHREGGLLSGLQNDLENAAAPLIPGYSDTLETLKNHGSVFASLSGSGSTLFGLYRDNESAQTAAEAVGIDSVRVVRLLSRDEYRRRLFSPFE